MEINKIYNEDNLKTMNQMPDRFLDGVICSPPYNQSIKRRDNYYNNGYSEIDNLSEEDYINTRIKEFKEFDRILKEKGSICYNISYHHKNPILPTLLISEVHKQTNLTLADIIIWKKATAIPFQTSSTKTSRICELVYVFVHKDHLHDFITNKEVSKVNAKTGQNFYKNYTNIIYAKNNDGIKTKLKATFSTDLVKKLINIYFKKGSLIYDGFSGLGTCAVACKESGLNYIGSELNEEFYNQSLLRFK